MNSVKSGVQLYNLSMNLDKLEDKILTLEGKIQDSKRAHRSEMLCKLSRVIADLDMSPTELLDYAKELGDMMRSPIPALTPEKRPSGLTNAQISEYKDHKFLNLQLKIKAVYPDKELELEL